MPRRRRPGDPCLCTNVDHGHSGRCDKPVYGRNSRGGVLKICDSCRAETYELRRRREVVDAIELEPAKRRNEVDISEREPALTRGVEDLPPIMPPYKPPPPVFKETGIPGMTDYRTDMPPDDDEDIWEAKF